MYTYGTVCTVVVHTLLYVFSSATSPTQRIKQGPVKQLAIQRGFVDLPVARVHDGPLLAAHDEGAAVGDGVRHARRLDPAAKVLKSVEKC